MALTPRNPMLRYLLCNLCLLLLFGGCKAMHHFQYCYALIVPTSGFSGVIEDAWGQVCLVLAEEVGLVHLAITNKGPQTLTIVWAQSYYLDPFGRRRQALQTGGQEIFRAPGWFIADTRLEPGAELRVTVRPGGLPVSRPPQVGRPRSAVDPRLPSDDDIYGTAHASGQFTVNPFTALRYESGEVVVAGTPTAFLPTAGDSAALGESYKDREFRFILTLRHGQDLTPYTFTFRITDVEVR
jgi:hypothetical protein